MLIRNILMVAVGFDLTGSCTPPPLQLSIGSGSRFLTYINTGQAYVCKHTDFCVLVV